MRFLLLAFLMCLLPLRGWTSTAMATGMAVQQVATVQTASVADIPSDCPLHVGASSAHLNALADTPSAPCSGCDTCELCLAIAVFTAPQFHATPFSHRAADVDLPHGFVSADHASRLKPPIS